MKAEFRRAPVPLSIFVYIALIPLTISVLTGCGGGDAGLKTGGDTETLPAVDGDSEVAAETDAEEELREYEVVEAGDDLVVHHCRKDPEYDVMAPPCAQMSDCLPFCGGDDNRWLCTAGACEWACAGAEGDQCGAGDDVKTAPPADTTANGTDGRTKIFYGSADPTLLTTLTAGQQAAVAAVLEGGGNICTATVINPRVVLTAAHCAVEMDPMSGTIVGVKDPSSLEVGIGGDMAAPEFTLPLEEIKVHSQYGSGMNQEDHDIALLILKESAWVSMPDLEPIPANGRALDSSVLQAQVQTVGYGTTQDNSYNTKRWWTTETLIEYGEFGIAISGGGTSSVCYGDSGGPMLYDFGSGPVVLGTVSWGDESCMDTDHFARVDTDLPWIQKVLDDYPQDCGAVTESGECQGNTFVRCDQDRPRFRNCTAEDKICRADRAGKIDCREKTECDRLEFKGKCMEDDSVQWCDAGIIKERRCKLCDMVCGWVDAATGYYCYKSGFPGK